LDAEGVFLLQGGEIAQGHEGTGVAKVVLERLGVSGLAESFNGVGLAEQVRVDPFLKTSFLGGAEA
jgi:hypothetical protein